MIHGKLHGKAAPFPSVALWAKRPVRTLRSPGTPISSECCDSDRWSAPRLMFQTAAPAARPPNEPIVVGAQQDLPSSGRQLLRPRLDLSAGSAAHHSATFKPPGGLREPGYPLHPGYCNAAPIWPFCACAKAGRSELTFRKAKRRCRGAGMGFAGTEYRPNTERSRPWRRHGCEDRGGDPCGVAGPKDQAGTGGGIPWLSARSEARRRRRTGSPRSSWR